MISLSEMSMLTTLYTQPHRKYHNINHINDCLTELEQFPANCLEGFSYRDRQIVEASIWYHDAVYNPYSTMNEANSAKLISERYQYALFEDISKTVLATAKHLQTQTDLLLATQVMLDIDLSGLGKPWAIYVKNGFNIRDEYYNTTDYDFLHGRMKFLETINNRETFYYTNYFKNKYHEQSKLNVEHEIRIINRSGVGNYYNYEADMKTEY